MPTVAESAAAVPAAATPPQSLPAGAVRVERFQTFSIRRVHQFPDHDKAGDFVVDEWAEERPAKYAGLEPLAEFWRMVGFYADPDGEPCVSEISDAINKSELVVLYGRLTGRELPPALMDPADTHNLPA